MWAVALAVAGYGTSMVLLPAVAGGLFESLGFGMRQAGIADGPARDYVLFIYGVLGAVIVGWMTLVVAITAGQSVDGDSAVRRSLVWSVGVWFVLDTGMSLVVGQWQHALFNLAFLVALGLPLIMWHRASGLPTPQNSSASQ